MAASRLNDTVTLRPNIASRNPGDRNEPPHTAIHGVVSRETAHEITDAAGETTRIAEDRAFIQGNTPQSARASVFGSYSRGQPES